MKLGTRAHLVQQRHHLVMGLQAGAGREGHRRRRGHRDQQQDAVGRKTTASARPRSRAIQWL